MNPKAVRVDTCTKFNPTSPFGGYKESRFGREADCRGWRHIADWIQQDAFAIAPMSEWQTTPDEAVSA